MLMEKQKRMPKQTAKEQQEKRDQALVLKLAADEALTIKIERDKLVEQARINELLTKERDVSNKSYARKEFEKAIIWFVVVLVGAVLLAIVNGIVK